MHQSRDQTVHPSLHAPESGPDCTSIVLAPRAGPVQSDAPTVQKPGHVCPPPMRSPAGCKTCHWRTSNLEVSGLLLPLPPARATELHAAAARTAIRPILRLEVADLAANTPGAGVVPGVHAGERLLRHLVAPSCALAFLELLAEDGLQPLRGETGVTARVLGLWGLLGSLGGLCGSLYQAGFEEAAVDVREHRPHVLDAGEG